MLYLNPTWMNRIDSFLAKQILGRDVSQLDKYDREQDTKANVNTLMFENMHPFKYMIFECTEFMIFLKLFLVPTGAVVPDKHSTTRSGEKI
jgi:hypothetical protein